MIRVVLAVLLSAAIVAMAVPAAEQGREERADALVQEEATTLGATVERLARRNDPVPAGEHGATRPVTVRIPDGVTMYLGTPGATSRGADIRWTRGAAGDLVSLGVPLVGELVLGPGRHRLRLSLVRVDGDPAVTVRRFKPGEAATPSRVRTPIGRQAVSL